MGPATPTTAPAPGTAAPRDSAAARRRWVVAAVAAALIGAGLTLVGGPHSPDLDTRTGDPVLAADLTGVLRDDRGLESVSAARVVQGETVFAGLGGAQSPAPTPDTPFELGSITKTMTGLLLADGITHGELALDATLQTYLPELAGTAVGSATLEQLATHTAGLPPFPTASTPAVLFRVVTNQNPYDDSTAAMLAAARTTTVTDRGQYRYSNLGMALLGHAEARAAGVADWPTLATQRILGPLEMTQTNFARSAADVPAGAAPPRHQNGWPAAYWYGPAFAPAGSSTWTTARDLARYADALLAGTVPGRTALEPRRDIPRGRIGLAFHLREVNDRSITWHNGGTGGYRTIMALDRRAGRAVIVLTNSTRDVDAAGMALAASPVGAPPAGADRLPIDWPGLLGTLAAGLVLVLSAGRTLLRGRDRLTLANAVALGIAGLLLLLVHGPWAIAPAWLWGALAGVSAVALLRGGRRFRSLPGWPARRRWAGLVSSAIALLVVVALVATC